METVEPTHHGESSEEGLAAFPTAAPAVASERARPLDLATLDALMAVSGLTATASDVLDQLGYATAVAGDVIAPRTNTRPVAGFVVTLSYLPARRSVASVAAEGEYALEHERAFAAAAPGDVVVVDASRAPGVSTLGGVGAASARRHEVAAIVVDGAIRDLDQIDAAGLPAWSRSITPVTGKWRLAEGVVNEPVGCAGAQVRPGDLALADATGVCFVPEECVEEVVERILRIAEDEVALREAPE